MEQNFENGDLLFENTFCHSTVFWLPAMLHDAAGAMRAIVVNVLVTNKVLNQDQIHVCLVTSLDSSFAFT